MCRDLKLSPSDLPFVAELISVAEGQRDWEASSIEQCAAWLCTQPVSLQRHLRRVAGYVDRTRLVDAQGHGQALGLLAV